MFTSKFVLKLTSEIGSFTVPPGFPFLNRMETRVFESFSRSVRPAASEALICRPVGSLYVALNVDIVMSFLRDVITRLTSKASDVLVPHRAWQGRHHRH